MQYQARRGRSGSSSVRHHTLTAVIADEQATLMRASRAQTPIELVARYVASTYVLVLNRWVETDTAWTPAEADAHFRALVMPTLISLFAP